MEVHDQTNLAYVFYGAVHTLLIVRRNTDAEKTIEVDYAASDDGRAARVSKRRASCSALSGWDTACSPRRRGD